ncbi:PaaI family thioesterase [Thermosyntropha sp.]|uniref:PaaI family thioesterase n=1 Tax=Thermosyntropha sp. TaxID=2740820 RepID=UPI0025E700F7|nr:PaaI family thioesterase [Thermosyntropha sp.]MBO8158348.1 PaaI family thioesterase [Thermosyntropha sp.]
MAINESIDEKLFNYIIKSIEETPFYRSLGLKLEKAGKGYVRLSVLPDENHLNPIGMVHGGLIMSIADAAMGNAIRTLGSRGVTADISVNFLSPPKKEKPVIAEGKVVKAGKNLIFTEAKVYSEGNLVAKSQAVFFRVGEIS